MILGVGTDIISVARMERVFSRSTAEAFKERVFTHSERQYCEKMSNATPYYAARWALKEAFYKALPLELQGVSSWKSIELLRQDGKKPEVVVCTEELRNALSNLGDVQIHHSISHEKEFCVAMVTLELREQY